MHATQSQSPTFEELVVLVKNIKKLSRDRQDNLLNHIRKLERENPNLVRRIQNAIWVSLGNCSDKGNYRRTSVQKSISWFSPFLAYIWYFGIINLSFHRFIHISFFLLRLGHFHKGLVVNCITSVVTLLYFGPELARLISHYCRFKIPHLSCVSICSLPKAKKVLLCHPHLLQTAMDFARKAKLMMSTDFRGTSLSWLRLAAHPCL